MKRIYSYILLMVCGLLFASCQKDYLGGMWEIELEDYQGSNGKIYLNDNRYACLVNGDTVRMFMVDSTASYKGNIVLPTSEGGKAQLVLENDPILADSTKLVALYSPSSSESNNKATQYEYTTSQNYGTVEVKGRTYQKLEAPMVGQTVVGNGNILRFYNLCAMVKVNIKNNSVEPLELGNIILSPKAGTNKCLNGIQIYGWKDNGEPDLTGFTPIDGANSITLDFFNNPSLVGIGDSADYYIFVPANQEYAYTVEVLDGEYNPLVEPRTTVPITIPRSHMIGLDVKIGGETPPAQDGSEENN